MGAILDSEGLVFTWLSTSGIDFTVALFSNRDTSFLRLPGSRNRLHCVS